MATRKPPPPTSDLLALVANTIRSNRAHQEASQIKIQSSKVMLRASLDKIQRRRRAA